MAKQRQDQQANQQDWWTRFREGLPPDWRATLSNPRPFLWALAGMAILMIAGFEWFYSARFSDLEATIGSKDATIQGLEKENERLRIAAGIDPAKTSTALSVLTNTELAAKAINVVAVIRELSTSANARVKSFMDANPKSEATTDAAGLAWMQRLQEIWGDEGKKINQRIGTESILVLNELHRRIPEDQRQHILHSGLRLREIGGQGVEIMFMESPLMAGVMLDKLPTYANEIEALGQLLPPD